MALLRYPGVVAISQMATISPTFCEQREFDAIPGAVLASVSLFGGCGTVFSRTLLGAVFIQTIVEHVCRQTLAWW